jgi:hypothetical protein
MITGFTSLLIVSSSLLTIPVQASSLISVCTFLFITVLCNL